MQKKPKKLMKIYFAGSYVNRMEVRGYMETLRKHGFEITEDWTRHIAGPTEFAKLKQFAKADFEGVRDCDIFLIHFPYKSMGKAWEFGAAYALNKPIYIVGEWDGFKCIFTGLIQQENFYEEFKPLLKELKKVRQEWIKNSKKK